jgi:hypothetical protein
MTNPGFFENTYAAAPRWEALCSPSEAKAGWGAGQKTRSRCCPLSPDPSATRGEGEELAPLYDIARC